MLMHLWHYDLPEHAPAQRRQQSGHVLGVNEIRHTKRATCVSSRTPCARHREAGAKDARVAQPEGANRSGPPRLPTLSFVPSEIRLS